MFQVSFKINYFTPGLLTYVSRRMNYTIVALIRTIGITSWSCILIINGFREKVQYDHRVYEK